MPKYWVKNYFTHGRFPEVGQKQKTEKKKERKKERAKVGNNNGQLRIATPPRVAHAKPPGPKVKKSFFLHISSSYAKILGETNFHTQEFPRSGSKAEDGEKERKWKD